MKSHIPTFDFYKKIDNSAQFEFSKLEESYNPYDASAAHRHNYFEIIYFEKSGGKHEIDFKTYEIEEGSIHFVSPEQVHRLRREKQVTGFVISFTADFFLNEAINETFIDTLPFFNDSEASPILPVRSREDRNELTQLISKIEREFNSVRNDKMEMIASYLLNFLLLSRRLYETNQVSKEDLTSRSTLVRNFKKAIEVNFREKKSVSEYAQLLNISSGHLNDTIQKEVGKTASELLYARIILEAKRLLYHSAHSVKEIAADLNYDDPSHFSRFFKNHTGQTPEQFRISTREMSH
jgi:AraC-like DNA-binding protein/mannose-6-phosphate isomerase-like protein (cupin superfamily)